MNRVCERIVVRAQGVLHGSVRVPSDKSISHRAVLLGAIAHGITYVNNWLVSEATNASLHCIEKLGIVVERSSEDALKIYGGNLQKPADVLYLGDTGTGMRLLAGILCGQTFPSILDGSEQLRHRPMDRIITPLSLMGAKIQGTDGSAPLSIRPSRLHGICYPLPMASAQVKSAILLAGLFAEGITQIIQPGPARDHTEMMLKAMGADLVVDGNTLTLKARAKLNPISMRVPADFSSAAFLLVAALLVPGSKVTLVEVNINPTRIGLLNILAEMGAKIEVKLTGMEAGEPVGTIQVCHTILHGITIHGEKVVRMIDEFPIFMVAASQAEGATTVYNAEELRVKESDRLATMIEELKKLGAKITETADGFFLQGPQVLKGAEVNSHGDHRIAMALTVAGLRASGQTVIQGAECILASFPGFAAALAQMGAELSVENDLP